MIRKLLIFAILALVITSCRDEYVIDDLQDPSKIVAYCFPTAGDTTLIRLSRSIPVQHLNDPSTSQTPFVVSYSLNGEPQNVVPTDDEGTYLVIASQQEGDAVSLSAAAEGLESVTAQTQIPSPCPIQIDTIRRVQLYDSSYEEFRNFVQVKASFQDDGSATNYYAVRLIVRNDIGYDKFYQLNDQGDTIASGYGTMNYEYLLEDYPDFTHEIHIQEQTYMQPELYIGSEPVLSNLTDIDKEMGFEDEFYQGFYIFNDELFNGRSYTITLNAVASSVRNRDALFQYAQVELYQLTPECYHYFKSLNDMRNNNLAQMGFAQASPIISNVTNGIGIVGGYSMTKSSFKIIKP